MLKNGIKFLKSALTEHNPFNSTEDVLKLIESKKAHTRVKVTEIKFADMKEWNFDSKRGNLMHKSGKFFSIDGIRVSTNFGLIPQWEQPIINQPEVGILGIITKEFDGILYFLLQAKIEPGNINIVSLAPTLQATKSNYTQVHKGKKPLYLEYFLDLKNTDVLLDQLQSEQGARFLKKRNRNIIKEIYDEINVEEDFCWLTLGQIKRLLRYDNVINMDTRTVISGISYGEYNQELIELLSVLAESSLMHNKLSTGFLMSILDEEKAFNSNVHISSWLTGLKAKYELNVEKIPLHSIKDWTIDNAKIFRKDKKYFSVHALRVEIGNREVEAWTQPIIKPAQEGIIAFIAKKIYGIYHLLIQARVEAGNLDILELAPTVQCLTGNYRTAEDKYKPPFLNYILNAKKEQIYFSAYQSEEGGRFYKEQNNNVLVIADEDFPLDVPENYIWMTLNQIHTFLKYNNYINIEARSLLSAVSFI